MSQHTIIKCDYCGAEKKETNHWFIVYQELSRLIIETSEWDTDINKKKLDACGHQCVQTAVEEFLNQPKLNKE